MVIKTDDINSFLLMQLGCRAVTVPSRRRNNKSIPAAASDATTQFNAVTSPGELANILYHSIIVKYYFVINLPNYIYKRYKQIPATC